MLNRLITFRNLPTDFKYKRARWITAEEAQFIYDIIREKNIENFFEIGTANGFSSSIAAAAILSTGLLPNIHTWDIISRFKIYEEEEAFIDLMPHIKFHNKMFNMKDIPRTAKSSLFFIDGDHTSEGVNRDWNSVKTHLTTGDTVIFHDLYGYRCILKLIIRLEKDPKYKVERIRTERGLGIVQFI